MSGFDKVEMKWKGNTYTVEPSKVLRLIARIEEVITVDELMKYAARQSAPLAKLSMAYGVALRYVGVTVTDEEIFESIFTGNNAEATTAAITGLLSMMIPQSIRNPNAGDSNMGKQHGGPAGSSKKPTKHSSAKSVSSAPNSSGT